MGVGVSQTGVMRVWGDNLRLAGVGVGVSQTVGCGVRVITYGWLEWG